MDPVHIVKVSPREQPNGRTLYRITDSGGVKYATTNQWMASLCKRAMETKTPIRLWSGAGWFYRELRHVKLVETQEAAS